MQPISSISEFLERFPDEETCEKYLADSRWPNGIFCPQCENIRVYRLENQKRWKCGNCKHQFTVRTGLVIAESKVPLQKWLMTIWLITQGNESISLSDMASQLGVTQRTALFLSKRIKEAYSEKILIESDLKTQAEIL